jgi:hypothetical protein
MVFVKTKKVGGPGFEPGTSQYQTASGTTGLCAGCCQDCTAVGFELYKNMCGAPLYGAPRIAYP